MSEPLYTLEILRLAAESGAITRLASPDASASQRSPLCGSSIVIDLTLNGDVVSAVGGEVRACAFGQASAALFARSAAGRTVGQIGQARSAIDSWLRDAAAPAPVWPGLEALSPARTKRARHAAILLPFDAALAALATASGPV